MARLKQPPPLRPDGRFAVISPGRWMEEEDLRSAADQLQNLGMAISLHPQNFLRNGEFAGTDRQRARAIMEVFQDPTIDAVICAKGGYGTTRTLEYLDFEAIRTHAKPLMGYSDATALLVAVLSRAGLVTFHGPMLHDVGTEGSLSAWQEALRRLAGEGDRALWTSDGEAQVLRPGEGTGRLVGGNLSLLVDLIGTSEEPDTTGAILFIEDCDERLYRVDRSLMHLRRSGKLEALAGLVVGQMTGIEDSDPPLGMDLPELIADVTRGYNFPIASDAPIGHGIKQIIVPLGMPAHLLADNGAAGLLLSEPS